MLYIIDWNVCRRWHHQYFHRLFAEIHQCFISLCAINIMPSITYPTVADTPMELLASKRFAKEPDAGRQRLLQKPVSEIHQIQTSKLDRAQSCRVMLGGRVGIFIAAITLCLFGSTPWGSSLESPPASFAFSVSFLSTANPRSVIVA